MNGEERAISNSTELCRFNVPAPAPAPTPTATAAPVPGPTAAPAPSDTAPTGAVTSIRDHEAEDFVASVLADRSQPVALFALEWCEFCWSVRNFLNAAGIGYRSIDLDSVAFQHNDLGGRIRKVLNARTGITSIPQVFIGDEFVGGCTETFNAYQDGRLQDTLIRYRYKVNVKEQMNPYQFLPNWIAKSGTV
jgi:cysteine synthase A